MTDCDYKTYLKTLLKSINQYFIANRLPAICFIECHTQQKGVFRTLSNTYDGVVFAKLGNGWKLITILTKSSTIDI